MFQHLDDPAPPVPSPALGERLRAEGARRRRRRHRFLGGGLAGAAVLLLAVAQPWDTESKVDVGPSNTTSTEPSPSTSTTVGEGTSTTAPTAATFPTHTFAAVTRAGELVLASIDTGETELVLDQLGTPFAWQVARAPDGSAVYAVDQSTADAQVLRYTPGGGDPTPMGTGVNMAVSPDGDRLAIAATTPEGGVGIVRILDAATGDVLEEVSILEQTGRGELHPRALDWERSGDRLLVEANMPEVGSEIFVIEPDGGMQRLGPPDGLPNGTGWYLGGSSGDGSAWVQESCCALDANSYDGGRSVLSIDTRTGAVLERHALDVGASWTIVDAAPGGFDAADGAFLLFSPSYEGNEAGAMFRGTWGGSLEPLDWPGFTAIGW
jgi:hypothetical protein